MELKSVLRDERIKAYNVLLEMTIGEYLDIAKCIISNNEFQRKKVKSSNSIYLLLKEDLQKGCIIPPVVLALGEEHISEFIEANVIQDVTENREKLLILDGLQRTYSMLDIQEALINSQIDLERYRSQTLRIELYIGVNRIGILYRMLTLNTGQTPMSNRHQLEILFADYADKEINGIKMIKEVEETKAVHAGEYRFKDVIDGFNSYLERNELPLDRFDILERINSLEKLSKENQDKNIFEQYITTFNDFIIKMIELTGEWSYDEESLAINGAPFGKNALFIFSKSQVMTGFGAAIGKLKDFGIIEDFDEIKGIIKNIYFDEDVDITLTKLIGVLDHIRMKSPKIGNAQRMYFQYFIRELFNKSGDSYLAINLAITNSFQKYLSQTE